MRTALLTMTRDEGVFLPVFLRYYTRHFKSRDIYILDNDTKDGSTTGLDEYFHVVPCSCDRAFAHMWMVDTCSEFAHKLLESYDRVLRVDVDEIVMIKSGNLETYLDSRDYGPGVQSVRSVGYNIIHKREEEPPLDWRKPILAQRKYWVRSRSLDKHVLLLDKVDWNVGYHFMKSPRVYTYEDPNLLLLHLHSIDFDTCMAKHKYTASLPWDQDSLRKKWGYQNALKKEKDIKNWISSRQPKKQIKLIPEGLKRI